MTLLSHSSELMLLRILSVHINLDTVHTGIATQYIDRKTSKRRGRRGVPSRRECYQ
jgi:hypothetical protein